MDESDMVLEHVDNNNSCAGGTQSITENAQQKNGESRERESNSMSVSKISMDQDLSEIEEDCSRSAPELL